VRLLLEEGADVAEKDEDGSTPQHRAAENGHEAVVQLLILLTSKS
jgi:ankyrin repeat protein